MKFTCLVNSTYTYQTIFSLYGERVQSAWFRPFHFGYRTSNRAHIYRACFKCIKKMLSVIITIEKSQVTRMSLDSTNNILSLQNSYPSATSQTFTSIFFFITQRFNCITYSLFTEKTKFFFISTRNQLNGFNNVGTARCHFRF